MFASDRRGVGYCHLYTINADGSGILQLTSGAAHDRKLQISPDGARIAFVREVTGRQQDAFVIASDGSSFVQLTSDGRAKNRLEWSPDGTKLDVEVPSEGKNYGGIYVITTDGSSTTRIVADHASTLVGDPTWSPDGTRIAYDALALPPPSSGLYGSANVFTVLADGTESTQVTHAVDSEFAGRPVYSPDGLSIAYDHEVLVPGPSAYTVWTRIAVIRTDGTSNVVLTTDTNYDERLVAWSANANRILFVRDPEPGGPLIWISIWTMSPDGSDRVQAANGTWDEREPVFSPDGARILVRFGADTVAPFGHKTLALDGSSPVIVNSNTDYDARWGTNTAPTHLADHLHLGAWLFGHPLAAGSIGFPLGVLGA